MRNIFVFTQNMKLESFKEMAKQYCEDENIFLTTNYLFENEREFLRRLFHNSTFVKFADFLTDEEMAKIDECAYKAENKDYQKHLGIIRREKNAIVCDRVLKRWPNSTGFLISDCDDLGLDDYTWQKAKFKKMQKAEFYFLNRKKVSLRDKVSRIRIVKAIYYKLRCRFCNIRKFDPEKVYVTEWEGKKYIFLGRLFRIDYRLNVNFAQSAEECEKLNRGEYYPAEECQYLTTWHEHGHCAIPDKPEYDVRWIQDGYLPPNYTHSDYNFKPNNVKYYAWDVMGEKLFRNKDLPVSLIPFRKKLYMPEPVFPREIKNVLIIASGSGDWTALKNRSDDDMLVEASVKLAERFPNIHFTFRCHPTWIHPLNVPPLNFI